MRKVEFIVLVILTILISSCSKEVPMSVKVESEHLKIEGNTADYVHVDTMGLTLIRDSVANPDNDFYNVIASMAIVLDSVYPTDQVVDSLMLNIKTIDGFELAKLLPIESQIVDSITNHLQGDIGKSMNVIFGGQMSEDAILQMKEGANVVFSGFSFIFADPKITSKLNEYEKYLKAIREVLIEMAEYQKSSNNAINSGFGAIIYMVALRNGISEVEVIDRQLQKKIDKMTTYQKLRYEAFHKELKSFNF